MSEVFYFTAVDPRARDNYRLTIEQPVSVEEIGRDEPAVAAALAAAGLETVRCWGSLPGDGNRRSWERMQPGHWALTYVGDGRFPQLLRLAHKASSRKLAERLWGRTADDRAWELMSFFAAGRQIDLDIDQVRDVFGYEGDWWPQGLQYTARERQQTLLEKLGSVEALGSLTDSRDAESESIAADAEELLFGPPFKGVPTKPPRQRRSGPPADPDVTGRGLLAHERTVGLLVEHLGPSFRTGTRGVSHDGVWRHGEGFQIVEVKSITRRNEVEQLRKGLGQVLHNRFKAEWNGVEIDVAYLVAEREPTNSELWAELCRKHDIVFTWPERFEDDIPRPG